MDVDIVLLSRDLGPLRDDVRLGIESQSGARPIVHRAAGTPRPEDANRWETIARARNEAKRRGSTPWVMLLDDDVVLAPDCLATLLAALRRRPGFAALGADSDGEMAGKSTPWSCPPHVGMAVILFRRAALERVTFRWEPDRCECSCCVEDLRRAGYDVGYLPGARARHLRHPAPHEPAPAPPTGPAPAARVLSAFDRHHYRKFLGLFLRTFRASGNRETVTALAYDLRPAELRALEATPGVEVVARRSRGLRPADIRLEHFPEAMSGWPDDTPAAYWDAGDVLFQGPVAPLWEIVRAHPDRILAVREPCPYDESPSVRSWLNVMRDAAARDRLLALFAGKPILNGGFVAGTARALRGYLLEANEIRVRTRLDDQSTLNAFCHANPDRWREVPHGWNYCLAGRAIPDRIGSGIEGEDGNPVHVAHGNAGTLNHLTFHLLHA